MNKKYLFGMLLSGAMLAACTADDDLNAVKVSQDVNPASPVFNVRFDDGDLQNRAQFLENGWKVGFQAGDKLSLFHGIVEDNLDGLSGWQNAIYLAATPAEDAAEGDLQFTTQAMVQPGYAIMVWPADLGFDQMDEDTNLGAAAPRIRIEPEQNATQKENTPYISEVIYISKENDEIKDGAGAAGYGKEYDIVLRRAAATLTLTLDNAHMKTVAGADPLTIKAVELDFSGADGTNRPFTVSIPLKAGDDVSEKFKEDYPSWKYSTTVDKLKLGDADLTGSLKTTDVVDNTTATFTFLPFKKDADLSTGKIIAYTNYGKVELNEGSLVWGSSKVSWAKLVEGIGPNLFFDEYTSGTWKGEAIGGHVSTRLAVDMDSLDMNYMHIETSGELRTALKVYDVLYANNKNKNITFILDGDDDGVFEVDADVALDMAAHMKATADNENKGLKFEACDTTACTTVKITNTAAVKEVPSLTFTNQGSKTIDVQLDGDWKYTGVTAVSGDKDNRKKFVGVKDLIVLGTLDLQDNIAANGLTHMVYAEGAEVTVTGTVNVYITTDNYGTVTIAEGQTNHINNNQLLANGSAEFRNREAQDHGDDAADGWSEGAKIYNGGTLAVSNQGTQSAVVYNYGIIEVTSATAITNITANSKTNMTIAKPFTNGDGGDRMGTIVLYDPQGSDNHTTVKRAECQGFIKITVTEDDITSSAFGSVANYAVIGGSCTEVKSGTETEGNKYSYLPTNIKYLEINSTEMVKFKKVKTNDKFTLNGLFVKEGMAVDIPEGETVELIGTAGVLYNKGLINHSGTFGVKASTSATTLTRIADTNYGGYFNGKSSDGLIIVGGNKQ